MEAIILCDGNNNFREPHTCRRKLEKTRQLPISIKVLDSFKEKP